MKTLVMGVYKFELTVTDNGGLLAKDTVQVIVYDSAINQRPIANAGTDQIITLPVDSVLLNGNQSFDPDGNIVSYQWTKISGPSSFAISNSQSIQTKIKNLSQGVYQFELIVIDNLGLSAKDTVQIIVNSFIQINQPPVANAGRDHITSLTLTNITIDGSGSFDSDGTIASALWTKINGPGPAMITDPKLLLTTVSGLSKGVYNFRLQVTDNMGSVDDDTVQIEMVDTLRGQEIIYNGGWGCNDLCRDGDVYWDSSPWNSNLYSDPNTPLQVSIRLDTSSVWIDVRNINSPLPPINQFYWQIDRGYLWVFAYEGKLIGTKVTVKVKFL